MPCARIWAHLRKRNSRSRSTLWTEIANTGRTAIRILIADELLPLRAPETKWPKASDRCNRPKLPRLVQTVAASRCFNCTVMLGAGSDFKGNCPKCGVALHCCKQCVNFDSSTRFQCLKPIPIRIPLKDKENDCSLFAPRITVARDASPQTNAPRNGSPGMLASAPRSASDARAAFDSLFKK